MGKVYALGDLHGHGGLWNKIKDFLQPDDILYFIGDAIDRGNDSFTIACDLLFDKRVMYLKGNHEFMAENALYEMIKVDKRPDKKVIKLWTYSNGGQITLDSIIENGALYKEWADVFHNLPLQVTYTNKNGQRIILCHAGFTLGMEGTLSEFNLVWDRDHLTIPTPDDKLDSNIIVVHGHTPTPILKEYLNNAKKYHRKDWYDFTENNGIIFYGQGHKIDIDCGAIFLKKTALLDLDTLEVIPFSI